MAETRKSLIELIEHYMDKTLSEWCLIKIDLKLNNDKYINQWSIITNITDIDWKYIHVTWRSIIRKLNDIEKIIWHYDITAVLKYIWNHNWNFQQTYKDDFIWMTWRNLEMSISDISIPNKPLHLYTEQEEANLLNLLLKLK
jgi:hypothetical protein